MTRIQGTTGAARPAKVRVRKGSPVRSKAPKASSPVSSPFRDGKVANPLTGKQVKPGHVADRDQEAIGEAQNAAAKKPFDPAKVRYAIKRGTAPKSLRIKGNDIVLHEKMPSIIKDSDVVLHPKGGVKMAPLRRKRNLSTVEKISEVANPATQVAVAGKLIAAAAKHPGRTVQGLSQQVTGIAGAAGQVGLPALDAAGHAATGHPKKALKDLKKSGQAVVRVGKSAAEDYEYRYGPALRGDWKTFDKRAAEDPAAGLTDLAAATGIAGKIGRPAARAIIKSVPKGKAFLEAPRPKLKVSGGEAVAQKLSKKPTRVAMQRVEDKLRQKVNEPTTKVIGRKPDSEGRAQALQPSGVTHVKFKRGKPKVSKSEVVPISRKLADRRQRIEVSRASAKAHIGGKHEGAVELNQGAEKAITGLSRKQRDAVFHVTQSLVPVHGTVGEITDALKARRQQLVDAGAPKGAKILRPHTELATIDRLLKNPEKVFGDSKLPAFNEAEVTRGKRIAEGDQALRSATQEARRYRPQGEMLGEKYEPPKETATNAAERDTYNQAYVKRVQAKAEAKGLPEPAYVQHAKRPTIRRSARTSGNVAKAVKGPKASAMKLFNEGRAVTSPHIYVQGLADTIKRKHQWNAVADVAQEHAFSWSKDKHGAGKSIEELRNEVDQRGLRDHDVTYINFGLFRKIADELDTEKAVSGKHFAEAVSKAVVPGETAGSHLLGDRGYVAVPRAVGDELLESTRPGRKTSRVFGKLQGLQSAAILGTNPSWIQMQLAANTLQTAAGTGGRLDMVPRAARTYRKLTPEQKRVVDNATGVGVYEGHTQTARLGAHQGRVAKAFEDVGQIPVFRTKAGVVRVTDANPLKMMFRMDNAQNTVFRHAVFFNEIRKAQKALAKVTPKLKGDPKAQLDAVLADPRLVDEAARHVDAVLGDYLRYTSRERRALKPTVMFYGFLRYATKTLFYTLPVHHPLTGAIALKLGQLHAEDVKKIYGSATPPAWAYSRSYEYDDKGRVVRDAKGRPKYRDLARISPLTSIATDVVTEGPPALFGLLSPLAQAAADMIANKNVGQGRPLRLRGSAEEQKSVKPGDIPRIIGNQVASSTLPGRYIMSQAKGTQGDDALPFLPAPTHFKTPEAAAKDAQRQSDKPSLSSQLFPLFEPRSDTGSAFSAFAKLDKTITAANAQLKVMRAKPRGAKGGARDEFGYQTKEYVALLKKSRQLSSQKAKLLKIAKKKPDTIKRRPATVDEQASDRLKRQLDRVNNLEKSVQDRLDRQLERAKIAAGG